MSRVTIPQKQKTYDALFAADVLGSNRWNAMLTEGTIPEIAADFTEADPIEVETAEGLRFAYEGYTRLMEIHRRPEGIQVILEREAEA